jgi:hypothetical protein
VTQFLALLAALAKLVQPLLAWVRENKVRQEGEAAVVQAQQKATLDDAAKVKAAQVVVANDLERHPDRVLEDDGFRRD